MAHKGTIWDLKIEFIDGTEKEFNHGIYGENIDESSVDELKYRHGGIIILEKCSNDDCDYDEVIFYPYNMIKNITYICITKAHV